MGLLAWTVLLAPFAWVAATWAVNRLALRCARRPVVIAVFGLSALSPVLAIVLYALVWGVARGTPLAGFLDPKLGLVLLEFGLPAALVTLLFALWGSKARLFKSAAIDA